MSVDAESRQTLLVAAATNLGQSLFARRRDEMVRDGRTLAGGWPGTVREARALAVATLAPAFARRHIPAPTDAELGWVTHAAYDEARRAWRTSIDRVEESD